MIIDMATKFGSIVIGGRGIKCRRPSRPKWQHLIKAGNVLIE